VNQFLSGSVQPQLPISMLSSIKIPLPPLEIQKQLVTEAEKEEEIITANRRLIELMEAKIKNKISEVWEE